MELADFVIEADTDFLVINLGFWESEVETKITQDEVIRYYLEEYFSMSGARSINGIIGDWRPMNELIDYCREYFIEVDKEKFEKKCHDRGLVFK